MFGYVKLKKKYCNYTFVTIVFGELRSVFKLLFEIINVEL